MCMSVKFALFIAFLKQKTNHFYLFSVEKIQIILVFY